MRMTLFTEHETIALQLSPLRGCGCDVILLQVALILSHYQDLVRNSIPEIDISMFLLAR